MRAPRRTRRWFLLVPPMAIAIAIIGAGRATAQAPEATAWWWVGGGASALVAPDVPDGGLYVANSAAGSAGISALRFGAIAGDADATLTLTVSGGQGTPAVRACPTTAPWQAAHGGTWDSRASYDCASSVPGNVSADGRTVSFGFGRLPRSATVDVAIVPDDSRSAFSVSFAAPVDGSLALTGTGPTSPPDTADTAAAAPSAPSTSMPSNAPVDPTGGSELGGLPPLAVPTPDDRDVADAAAIVEADRAEPSSVGVPAVFVPQGSGKPTSGGLYATLLAAVAVVVVLGRRVYQPNGSFVDVIVGKRLAGPQDGHLESESFARAWRIAVPVLATSIVWWGAARHLPQGLPPGVVVYGAVVGGLTGLLALGVVLVYRTNRVINFAQAAFGAVALVLTFELTVNAGVPYYLSVAIGIAAAAGVSGISEVAVMRRFRNAPRLIVTLGTIGLASIVIFLSLIVAVIFERDADRTLVGTLVYPSPLRGKAFVLSGIVFTWDSALAMVVVPVILIVLTRFLQRSWLGIGTRAVAENADRASLLAIPVGRLSTLAWVIAGALSAVATILRAPITGYNLGGLNTLGTLAIMLAALVVGRLDSLVWTFVGAVGIGVVDQVYFYNYARGSHLDAIHLIWILAALVLLPRQTNRAVWNETSSWRAFREVRPIPQELSALGIVRAARIAVPALAVGVVAFLPLVIQSFSTIRLASLIGVWAIAALSLVVLTGWGGQISLGQWAIVGVGAFTAAKLLSASQQGNLVVVLIAAAASGGIVAAIIGVPALRLRGVYLAIITLAFATAAFAVLFTLPSVVPTSDIRRPPFVLSERSVYYLVAFLLVACALAVRNIRASKLGRALIAARDNGMVAQSYGVNLLGARVSAFVISGVIAGLAGGLYSIMTQSISHTDFSPGLSLQLFAVAVIGGLGSISGALAGAVYVVGANYLLPSYGPFLATGLGMLVFLLVVPGGLGQIIYAARDAFLRRVAARFGIESSSLIADRRSPDGSEIALVEPADPTLIGTAIAAEST